MSKWNPYTPGYFHNPYVHLADCRSQAPIQLGIHNEWMLFKYNDVKKVLKSPLFGVTNLSGYFLQKEHLILEPGACPFLSRGTKKWIMYLDGQEHEQARELLERAVRQFDFSPVIVQAVDCCFRLNQHKERIDIVDIATQIPLFIVEEMLGIKGLCTYEQLKRFSHLTAVSQDIFIFKNTYREINEELKWAFSFFDNLYQHSLDQTESHVISFLTKINASIAVPLNKDEMISLIVMLLMAALETTKDTMSVVMYELIKSPSLAHRILSSSDTEINIIAEELLRYSSPLQYTVRVAKEDLSVNGYAFPKGTRLFLCLASANRDPEVFIQPEEILPLRKFNPHLSFGSGVHSCLGARIARNEIRSWLKPITEHLRHFQLPDVCAPVWQKTIFMRGIKSLEIVRK